MSKMLEEQQDFTLLNRKTIKHDTIIVVLAYGKTNRMQNTLLKAEINILYQEI